MYIMRQLTEVRASTGQKEGNSCEEQLAEEPEAKGSKHKQEAERVNLKWC